MRKTYITDRENCPRCKFNDLTYQILHGRFRSENVLDWFRRNTTYTEEQLKNCTHYCNRCSIVYQVCTDCETLKTPTNDQVLCDKHYRELLE